jgi:hypothetical protein
MQHVRDFLSSLRYQKLDSKEKDDKQAGSSGRPQYGLATLQRKGSLEPGQDPQPSTALVSAWHARTASLECSIVRRRKQASWAAHVVWSVGSGLELVRLVRLATLQRASRPPPLLPTSADALDDLIGHTVVCLETVAVTASSPPACNSCRSRA